MIKMSLALTVFLFCWNSLGASPTKTGESANQVSEESQTDIYVKKRVGRFDRETRVPKSLIKKIEKEFVKHFRIVHQESPLEDHEVRRKIPRRYLNIKVEFDRLDSQALDENIQYQTVQGSGVVDLQEVVMRNYGRFAVRLFADREGAKSSLEPSDVQVFFVGETKKTKIDGETFGSGCSSWMDVTTWFRKSLSKKGVELFAKRSRYLHVLGGTFYFLHFFEGTLYLSTMTFRDSRYPDRVCRRYPVDYKSVIDKNPSESPFKETH